MEIHFLIEISHQSVKIRKMSTFINWNKKMERIFLQKKRKLIKRIKRKKVRKKFLQKRRKLIKRVKRKKVKKKRFKNNMMESKKISE